LDYAPLIPRERGASGTALACLVGAAASVVALTHGDVGSLRAPWAPPLGELRVGLDALSALFLLCVFTVSGLAAVYGHGYVQSRAGERRLGRSLRLRHVSAGGCNGCEAELVATGNVVLDLGRIEDDRVVRNPPAPRA
jgi:formate hydrogenlyase subunit 3/multisubunit Na+/H+ antiporter MnhD subunit